MGEGRSVIGKAVREVTLGWHKTGWLFGIANGFTVAIEFLVLPLDWRCV